MPWCAVIDIEHQVNLPVESARQQIDMQFSVIGAELQPGACIRPVIQITIENGSMIEFTQRKIQIGSENQAALKFQRQRTSHGAGRCEHGALLGLTQKVLQLLQQFPAGPGQQQG